MGLYANQKKNSFQGIYAGSGVAQGGQQGRSGAMHMGIAAKSGGLNSKGTPTRGAGAAPIVKPGGSFSIPGTPAKTGLVKPGSLKPLRPAPAPYVAPQLPAINYHDSGYLHDLSGINYNYDTAGLSLPTMQKQYDLNLDTLNRDLGRTQEQSNADLAARGAYDSGGRVNADTDISRTRTNSMYDLDQTYGKSAQANLEAARTEARRLALGDAEQAAVGRYTEAHAADAPQIAPGTGVSNAAAPPPGKSYRSGFFKNGSGNYFFVNANGQIAPAAAGRTIRGADIVDAPQVQNRAWYRR